MTREAAIIELGHWLASPAAGPLVAWEQEFFDEAVGDAFGFHAVQVGLPGIHGLRANRMPHRWLAVAAAESVPSSAGEDEAGAGEERTHGGGDGPPITHLFCDVDALPFPSASIDLVVLPHALEMARDPHQTLREVERVLRPEGRLVVTGFNPASLWGLRQRCGHAWRGLGLARDKPMFLPHQGSFIGYWRLRDWLGLLSFEVESARFGAYRPPLHSPRWLERFAWMDRVGERWWPVLGAAYAIHAVKHVRGMRLVGLVRREARARRGAPAAIAQRQRELARTIAPWTKD